MKFVVLYPAALASRPAGSSQQTTIRDETFTARVMRASMLCSSVLRPCGTQLVAENPWQRSMQLCGSSDPRSWQVLPRTGLSAALSKPRANARALAQQSAVDRSNHAVKPSRLVFTQHIAATVRRHAVFVKFAHSSIQPSQRPRPIHSFGQVLADVVRQTCVLPLPGLSGMPDLRNFRRFDLIQHSPRRAHDVVPAIEVQDFTRDAR